MSKTDNPLASAFVSCRLVFRYALLFGFIINCLMLSTPIYSMQVLDRVISSGSVETLVFLTIVILLAVLLLASLQMLRSFLFLKMGVWLESTLGKTIFDNSVQLSVKSGVEVGSQQIRDLNTLKSYLTNPKFISLLDLPWAVIFIAVLYMIHWKVGVLTSIAAVILFILAYVSERYMKPCTDKSNETYIKSMKHIDQATRNAEVIEVMGMRSSVIQKWDGVYSEMHSNQQKSGELQSIFVEITRFLRMVVQVLVTGLGAYLVLQNEMTTGAIIACSAISGRALGPFESSMSSWKGLLTFRKAYTRLKDALEHYRGDDSEEKTSLPAPLGDLSVSNVYYSIAKGSKHILKNISFELSAGEFLLIMGHSASGKTTLSKLIVGAISPQLGTVRLDNANLKDWKRDELGEYIGYLPQDIELFEGTIKENIARMAQSDVEDTEVIEAATAAGIHDMILHMPDGYSTMLGPSGANISAGQRQRIGIARALFGSPKLVVLDEPNSNLDQHGELSLVQTLKLLKSKKVTLVVVAHRSSFISIADRILTLKGGMLSSFDTREGMMAKMKEALKKQGAFMKHSSEVVEDKRSRSSDKIGESSNSQAGQNDVSILINKNAKARKSIMNRIQEVRSSITNAKGEEENE